MMNMLACILVLVLTAGSDAGLHSLGLIPEDLDTVPGVREVTRVRVIPGRPNADSVIHVDLTEGIPPVGSQGRQGSCVSWAFAYYHKTQVEYVEHGWDVTDPNHQYSPAFMHNQINGGANGGSNGSQAMALLAEQGCANMVDSPYDQDDYLTWPTETAYRNGMWFRSGDASYINTGDTVGINRVRQHVANGYSCVKGIKVWANFDNIHNFNYTYCSSERCGTMRGHHAVTIVGYDDTLTTADGPGAFRLVNSWGTGWGDSGFFWMSYVAVMDPQMGGQQVEFSADRVGYEPVLVGLVRIDHSSREKIGLELGVGTWEQPLWFHEFRAWRWLGADVAFPDQVIAFDLTDGASALRGNPEDTIFIAVVDDSPDGRSGTIEEFGAEHLPWQTQGTSPDPPVFIPDHGVIVWAKTGLRAAGIEGQGGKPTDERRTPTILCNVLRIPEPAIRHSTFALLNSVGHKVMDLVPGPNDVRHLSPGVYFVRAASDVEREASSVHKVIVQR